MQNFELYNPVRVIFGNGETKDIGKYVSSLGKKAMIVSYEVHSFFDSLLEDVRNSLTAHGIDYVEFYKVQAKRH